jgi:hypothetical protein
MESKKTKSKTKNKNKTKSVRIGEQVELKLKNILDAANANKKMRKVKPDMVFNLVLDLVNESHIKTLQELLVTPDDRKEQMRQFYIETRGPISKLEYTGFTMKREYFEFLEQYEVAKEKRSIRIAG